MKPSFFKNLGPISIDDIKQIIDCQIINFPNEKQFIDFVGINDCKSNSLSFLYDNKSNHQNLDKSAVYICSKKQLKYFNENKELIVVTNVQEAVAKVSNIFYRDFNEMEISDLSSPRIGNNCSISDTAKIENGAIIGDDVKICEGAVVGLNCQIGNKSHISSNSVITNSIIGENVRVGSNTTIGKPGFGFYLNRDSNIDIYHIGRVILQSNVSIGSGCTIDRGSFSDTVIGENTYIDNLCHIAHNVQIGNNSALAAMTGIAGSAILGDGVLAGGQVGIAGHVKIGDNVQIAAKSGVFQDVQAGESVMGNPAINKIKYIRNFKKLYGKK